MSTEVIILKGSGGGKYVIGKVRLVDDRGIEITDPLTHGIKATLQESENVVGKIILADSEGEELPLIQTLLDGLNINNAVRVATKTVSCPTDPMEIPGIGTGAAYASGDVFGTQFRIKVPESGTIMSATYWDLDDEGLQLDLEIFKSEITQVADNGVYAPSDYDLMSFVTELNFFTFDDHGGSQTSEIENIGKAYTAPVGEFVIQAVARGAHNIAAGNLPYIQLQILSDDPDFEA